MYRIYRKIFNSDEGDFEILVNFMAHFRVSLKIGEGSHVCCKIFSPFLLVLANGMDKIGIRMFSQTFTKMMSCYTISAASRENVSSEIFDQSRFKPACSATEAS